MVCHKSCNLPVKSFISFSRRASRIPITAANIGKWSIDSKSGISSSITCWKQFVCELILFNTWQSNWNHDTILQFERSIRKWHSSLTWHNLANKISLEDCVGLLKTSRATVEIISSTRSSEIAKSKQVAQIFNCLDSINTRSGLDDTLWISCTMPINSEKAQFNWFNSEFKNGVVTCGLLNNTSLTCAWYITDGHGSENDQ